jgi:hypothetical protein
LKDEFFFRSCENVDVFHEDPNRLDRVPGISGKERNESSVQRRKGLFHKELKEAAISRLNGIISALLAYSLLNCGKAHPGHFSVYKKNTEPTKKTLDNYSGI